MPSHSHRAVEGWLTSQVCAALGFMHAGFEGVGCRIRPACETVRMLVQHTVCSDRWAVKWSPWGPGRGGLCVQDDEEAWPVYWGGLAGRLWHLSFGEWGRFLQQCLAWF